MKLKPRGFTLIELVLAMAIFAIVSVAITMTLQHILQSNAQLKKQYYQLKQLQKTFTTLEDDIEQMGGDDAYTVALQGEPQAMNFTTYDDGMKHVFYRYYHGGLERSTGEQKWLLLTSSKTLTFQYIGAGGLTYAQWPPGMKQTRVLPLAVRVIIDMGSAGKISQIFLIKRHREGEDA